MTPCALPAAEAAQGWTNTTQTFTNIRQDMVLVPVRDPMTNGPTLSDVGYKEQWDNDLGTNIRYAYQDLTFASADGIDTGDGAFSVMLVPAQLPRYGEKTYAAKDLKNRPLMGLRNSRLYADEKAYGSTDELNNNHYSIQTGTTASPIMIKTPTGALSVSPLPSTRPSPRRTSTRSPSSMIAAAPNR